MKSKGLAFGADGLYGLDRDGRLTRITQVLLLAGSDQIHILFNCPKPKESCLQCSRIAERLTGGKCVLEGADELLNVIRPLDSLELRFDSDRSVVMRMLDREIKLKSGSMFDMMCDAHHNLLFIKAIQVVDGDTRSVGAMLRPEGFVIEIGEPIDVAPSVFTSLMWFRDHRGLLAQDFHSREDVFNAFQKMANPEKLVTLGLEIVITRDGSQRIALVPDDTMNSVPNRGFMRIAASRTRIAVIKRLVANIFLMNIRLLTQCFDRPVVKDIIVPLAIDEIYVRYRRR